MAKKKITKRIKKNLKSTFKVGVGAVGGFLIVQGALALFPQVSGIVSIVIGFVMLTLLGIWEWLKK